MHTLILNAVPSGPRCSAALPQLQLPHLQRLLNLLTPTAVLRGAATDLTPVHERLVAASRGLAMGADLADGLIPWAALDARQLGLSEAPGLDPQGGWAWITPCHWTIQTDHVHMEDPQTLALTPHDADSLYRDMQPYFAEDGITLHASHVGLSHSHWLAHGRVFANLPTASLERVAGQVVDPWIPRQPQAQPLRRLQNEMQMLLYTHPVNDSRARFHLASVNAFWVSGTGSLPDQTTIAQAAVQECHVRNVLHRSEQQDDATSWVQAWEALDSTTLAHDLECLERGQAVQITLCGADTAQTFAQQPITTWQRLLRRLRPPQLSDLLKAP